MIVSHSVDNRFFPRWTGWFGEDGVVNLNRRAEAVMARLGVPIVPGYGLTHGEAWATEVEDGR